MLAVLALLLQTQAIDWSPNPSAAYKQADEQRRLVLVLTPSSDPEVARKTDEFLSDSVVVKALDRFIGLKSPPRPGSLQKQTATRGAQIEFKDKDGELRGIAFAPMDTNLFAKWVETIDTAWKKHDSLVFRSRGRMNESDSAKLAFSWAMRGETDRASGFLYLLPAGLKVEEAEFGWMALALSYSHQGLDSKATDAWLRLASSTKSPVLKSASRIGVASILSLDRPKEALVKYKEIVANSDTPSVDKWWSEHQVKLLQAIVDGGG